MKSKAVYFFGAGKAEGRADMKALLGGKGANLAEMTNLGIPVPPGFTITTEVCAEYNRNKRRLPAGLDEDIAKALARVEKAMGARFGDPERPLLVSVRSGARVSMPGMMDTILNVGLNDKTVAGLVAASDDERFAYDSYRRFVQMYGDVVLGVEHHRFEERMNAAKERRGVKLDTELAAEDWKGLVAEFKTIVKEATGKPFPEDPRKQLRGAIEAVFRSWNTKRAVDYRRQNGIPEEWGTAVNVQSMVFGNMGESSATGVAFTRDPATGENVFYGEWLRNAQGEDVVAGIRTPQPINRKGAKGSKLPTLEEEMPEIYAELEGIYKRLERHYRDMQDIEFTIQRGDLWILQTRGGKRTGRAAVRIAVDMVKEKLIDERTAVARVGINQLEELFFPTIDRAAKAKPAAKGLPASPGAFSGEIVLTAEEAEEAKSRGRKVILVRFETSPDDVHGMYAAEGVLTARGGMTSHAAVVARGMGKACVAGCADLRIDMAARAVRIGAASLKAGEVITLDGTAGHVYVGAVPTVKPELDRYYDAFMKMVEAIRKLGVRANADNPHDAEVARKFGAEGIGLCRTEHMFFQPERLLAVREMIFALDEAGRRAALEKILPMQREDFLGIFRAMSPHPVTIRLLDPPLHEFLPHDEHEMRLLAEDLGLSVDEIRARRDRLSESNPMLGHRGCRLGITWPEIYEIQTVAIMEAACALKKEGADIHPEIMIPLVGYVEELRLMRALVEKTADAVQKRMKTRVKYSIGTMIELPRAALMADKIAEYADFFSFGTNDLTQTALGISRDDAGTFLPDYVRKGILPENPFVSLDVAGVGQLVRMGVERGRKTNPKLHAGICGEHGGDPKSIAFCREAGLDYVSCSPYRVPVARFAAARAELERSGDAAKAAPKGE